MWYHTPYITLTEKETCAACVRILCYFTVCKGLFVLYVIGLGIELFSALWCDRDWLEILTCFTRATPSGVFFICISICSSHSTFYISALLAISAGHWQQIIPGCKTLKASASLYCAIQRLVFLSLLSSSP